MYRILVVDDEPEIADSITDLIQKEFAQIALVETRYVGRRAWERLQEQPFDLLMSDISMPGMNGLELLEHIKQSEMECRVVFLTGFREFDYAYKAMQSAGVSYLVKTEPDEKIVSCIRNVLGEISAAHERDALVRHAHRQLEELMHVVQKETILRLLRGELEPTGITPENFHHFGLPFAPDRPISMFLGRFDSFDEEGTTLQKYQLLYAFKDVLEEKLPAALCRVSVVDAEYQLVTLYQVAEEQNHVESLLAAALQEAQHKCVEKFFRTVSFAVSTEAVPFVALPQIYTELQREICLNVGLRTGMILIGAGQGELLSANDSPDLTGQYAQLAQDLAYRNETHFYKILCNLVEALPGEKRRSNPRVQEIYGNAAMVLLTFINRKGLNQSVEKKVPLYKLTRVDVHESWTDAFLYLHTVAEATFAVLTEEQEQLHTVVTAIHNYVERHIEDFSLNAMADALHFNPSYLSRLYRNNTGEKLQDYVQRKKLEYAVERLVGTNEKVGDIGTEIGFDTPQSFARFFRRLTGSSPQEYRQRTDKP